MSSSGFGAADGIDVAPSARLSTLLIAAHVVAAAALIALPLSWFLIAPALLPVAWSARHSVRLHGSRRAARAVVRMARASDGTWTLTCRDGRTHNAALQAGSFVHPLLLVLNFRTERQRSVAVVMLTAGSASDDVRRLRASLRWADSSGE